MTYHKTSFFYISVILKIICLLQMFNPTINECRKEALIPFNIGSCIFEFCGEQNSTSRICNIIIIDNKDFSYVHSANYSNGDLIVETTSLPGNSKRMFCALKKNGR